MSIPTTKDRVLSHSLLNEILFSRIQYRILILLTSLLATVFGLLGPFFQKIYVDSLTHAESHQELAEYTRQHPLIVCSFAFLSVLLFQCLTQFTNYLGYRESIIAQRELAHKLYRKMLDLRIDAYQKSSIGEIVSLYATDVPGATFFLEQTIPTGAGTLFPLLLAPLAISFICDIELLPIIVFMMAIALINGILAFRQSKYFYRFKQLAAERIGLVNEWIQNIRTLRILGWTSFFEAQIIKVREIETENRVAMVTNGQVMNAVSSSVSFFLNLFALISLVYFTKKQATGGEMLALLWILGVFLTRPFRQMPWFFTFAFDSWTSLKRLENFLNSQNTQIQIRQALEKVELKPALIVKNLSLHIQGRKILNGLTFSIAKGEFVGIVGEVGSGKSLLLLSLMGETGAQFDSYQIFSKDLKNLPESSWREFFSYVPQEAFIMSASLRENIVFNYDVSSELDERVYEALNTSQFAMDLEKLNRGLDEPIGERGVNLSGGQRQRVNIARVHYFDSDILLLDDCLSALDVNTENQIVDEVMNGIWKNRTRILVTHRLSVLSKLDRIIFISQGQILKEGTYKELLTNCQEFRNFTQNTIEKNDFQISIDSNQVVTK